MLRAQRSSGDPNPERTKATCSESPIEARRRPAADDAIQCSHFDPTSIKDSSFARVFHFTGEQPVRRTKSLASH
jgi:hypothetical protein